MNAIFSIFLLQGLLDNQSHTIVTENTRYWVIIGGASAVVALLLGIWILIVLRSNRARALRQNRRHDGEVRVGTEDSGSQRQRRHRRRRRHGETDDHMPRNPTLAETGGLPPLRERPGQRP